LFLLPLISGVLAYFSAKVSMKVSPTMGNPQQQSTSKSMMLMMPFMSVLFGFWMPGAIGVYMISQTVFSVAQDIWLTKRYTGILDAEDAVKLEQQRIKEAELEAKRLETERKKLENKTEVNPNTSKKKQQKTERQDQLEKAAEWEKKHTPVEKAQDPSRVDTRRFARGRAYDPSRFEQESGDVNGEEPVMLPAADEAADMEETPDASDWDVSEETADEAGENGDKAD
jgi:YidC/Oxa1 family membrane protein insertase